MNDWLIAVLPDTREDETTFPDEEHGSPTGPGRRAGAWRLAAARPASDPWPFYVLLVLAAMALIVLGITRSDVHARGLGWEDALPWIGLCAASNTLSIPTSRNLNLSMSSPVNIAVGLVLPTGLTALVVASSSLSLWEIRGETTRMHALYNRLQLGLSAAAAAALANVASTHDVAAPIRAVGTVVTYHAANWIFVGAAEATCRGVPLRTAIRRMLPPGAVSALTYLVLGFLGFALAATLIEVGVWAVVLLLVPLLGARHAVAATSVLEGAERAQRVLASRLIDERERERVRIAADIHDVVVQDLVGQQVIAGNVRAALAAGQPALAVDLAGRLEVGAQHVVDQLRTFVASLRRSSLDDGGLPQTLVRFGRAFSAQTGVEVVVTSTVDEPAPLPVELLVYECAQELLTNVARHANATRVAIALTRAGGVVELRLDDDGIGVDNASVGSGGTGIALLRDKVELVGGSVRVGRRAGGGTEVVVIVPTGTA